MTSGTNLICTHLWTKIMENREIWRSHAEQVADTQIRKQILNYNPADVIVAGVGKCHLRNGLKSKP